MQMHSSLVFSFFGTGLVGNRAQLVPVRKELVFYAFDVGHKVGMLVGLLPQRVLQRVEDHERQEAKHRGIDAADVGAHHESVCAKQSGEGPDIAAAQFVDLIARVPPEPLPVQALTDLAPEHPADNVVEREANAEAEDPHQRGDRRIDPALVHHHPVSALRSEA